MNAQNKNNKQSDKPVAIVIGGSGGIGSAIVAKMASQGVHVVAADKTGQNSPRASFVAVDATDESNVAKLVDRVVRQFGRIDYLVNAAGMFFMKPIEETLVVEWDKMLDMNLKIVFLTCKAVVPVMKRQQFGKIVNIASHAAHKKFPSQVAYKASKAGVIGFSESLDAELRPFNISVDVVSPATVATDGMKDSFKRRSVDWPQAHSPEEVAQVVWFLLSRPAKEHHFPFIMDHDLVL